MKYILIIALICGMLGCGDEPTNTYVLINKTEYNIQISAFSHRGTAENPFVRKAELVVLEPLGKIEKERSFGEGGSSLTYFSEASIDSVRIIFDDKKLLVLECDLSNTQVCHSIFQAFEATITQENYDSAELIE